MPHLRQSSSSTVGTSSGRALTVDPALLRVPPCKCAQCGHKLDIAGIIGNVIAEATTGVLRFPVAGEFRVVVNRGADGAPLSLQIMLGG